MKKKILFYLILNILHYETANNIASILSYMHANNWKIMFLKKIPQKIVANDGED